MIYAKTGFSCPKSAASSLFGPVRIDFACPPDEPSSLLELLIDLVAAFFQAVF